MQSHGLLNCGVLTWCLARSSLGHSFSPNVHERMVKIYQLHDFLHFSLTKSCSSILMKLHQASSFLSLFHFMRWDFFKEFLITWKHFEFGNQAASLSSTCNLTWSVRFISSAQKCWILNRDVSNLSQFFYIDKQEISPQNKEKTLSKKGLLFIVNLDSTL